jgi:hypothetical protein
MTMLQNPSLIRSIKGLVTSSCIPLPSPNLESNEPTCLWVEHYPFYGLDFKPLFFVNMFTSIGVHLFTSTSPQNALMFCVGKKCTRVGGIL